MVVQIWIWKSTLNKFPTNLSVILQTWFWMELFTYLLQCTIFACVRSEKGLNAKDSVVDFLSSIFTYKQQTFRNAGFLFSLILSNLCRATSRGFINFGCSREVLFLRGYFNGKCVARGRYFCRLREVAAH